MCENPVVPSYLHLNDKTLDQVFEENEVVFRNFLPISDETTLIPGDQIDVKRTSFNRGKYLEKFEDSLYSLKNYEEKNSYRIFGISVGAIRKFQAKVEMSKEKDKDRIYSLSLIHNPETCMYPHTVIQAFDNGMEVSEIKPNSVKNKYRTFIAEQSIIYPP